MPLPRPPARWIAAPLLVALVLAGGSRPRADLDLPVRWEGTATVDHTFTPAVPFDAADWDGSFKDSRTVRVRARESRRADVRGPGGVVGQLVWLEDDGTTWEGAVQDSEVHLRSIQLLAEGSGHGTARVFGVVYRSLGTPDPLAGVLPDGTYCLQAVLAPAIPYRQTIREAGRPDEVDDYESMSQLVAGDCSLILRLARAGGPLTVERVTAALRAPLDPSQRYMIEGQRVLADGVMTGRSSREIDPGSGTVVTVAWNVHRRYRLNGAIDPAPGSWRPRLGQGVTLAASLDAALGVTGRFRFTLYDVSREKGYALNAGGNGTGLDLQFESEQPIAFGPPEETADGWRIETTDAVSAAQVRVFALDYGAWGRLRAEVNVEGEWYDCLAPDGKSYVTVPLDENENRLWDTWERNTGVWGRPVSEDRDPDGDGKPAGDGFSNYEEYRGFVVDGNWIALDPGSRELLVQDPMGRGIGYFGASGLFTFVVDQGELDEHRVANFNRGYGSAGEQKGLLIEDKDLGDGTLGRVTPDVGTPNQVTHVYLDTSKLDDLGSDAYDSTVAHELGHAVDVPHHGDWSRGTCGGGPRGLIAPWGGAFAGDKGCVMAYTDPTYYRTQDGSCHPYPWHDTWGTSFCTSRTGTGNNAGPARLEDGLPLPVSGDARHGDCLHRVRLK
ncbi:MAG: hypothetical protein AB7O67_09995 [Vicinamibacterales bacterium]